MRTKVWCAVVVLLGLGVLLLASCGPALATTTAMLLATETGAPTAALTSTPPASLNPTGSADATPAPAASPTLTPTPTATATPTLAVAPSQIPAPAAGSHPWWNDTVFYEIFVRSFYDSNRDGIGDFNGLIAKLDYLNDGDPNTGTDLGVTGIWLMPIHPSPSSHGYDVTDYYGVDPEYGTLADFRRLVDECHRRGMRIIIDLPINHTSSQHPWFIQSQDRASPYRDWYIWADAHPGWLGHWNQQVWYPLGGAYYYAFFWEGMPDLNFGNPEVTAEMEAVTRFWLGDVGLDGFRLDAIGSLIEDGPVTVETKASHDWFARYFEFYKQINPEALTIGEVWREDAVVVPWVVNRQVDLAFEFDLAAAMLAAINESRAGPMLETLRSGTMRFPDGQYGTFLTNHDMARVMTQVGGDRGKAKAAASLYFSLPGVPFVYYGEEIGMVGDAPDAQGRRPMQWNGRQYAGFSEVPPWMIPPADYAATNVAVQTGDPGSLLSHYRALIALRNRHLAMRTGELILLSTSSEALFACLRATPDQSLLVLVNLAGAPIREYGLSVTQSILSQGEYLVTPLFGAASPASLTVGENGRVSAYLPVGEIAPHATIILRLQRR